MSIFKRLYNNKKVSSPPSPSYEEDAYHMIEEVHNSITDDEDQFQEDHFADEPYDEPYYDEALSNMDVEPSYFDDIESPPITSPGGPGHTLDDLNADFTESDEVGSLNDDDAHNVVDSSPIMAPLSADSDPELEILDLNIGATQAAIVDAANHYDDETASSALVQISESDVGAIEDMPSSDMPNISDTSPDDADRDDIDVDRDYDYDANLSADDDSLDDGAEADTPKTMAPSPYAASQSNPYITSHALNSRTDINAMRADIAHIQTDLESGDAIYRRAQRRINNLLKYAERTEVDLSLLDRLEPENQELKSTNRLLNSELESRVSQIAVLNNQIQDLQRRYDEKEAELDQNLLHTADLTQTLECDEKKYSEQKQIIDDLKAMLERVQCDYDTEIAENQKLREKMRDMSEKTDSAHHQKLDLAKRLESIKIDLNDQINNRDRLRLENHELRQTLEELQKQNTQMRGDLLSVHEEIRSFKTQYELTIIKRDDRIGLLISENETLRETIRQKDNSLQSASRDIHLLKKQCRVHNLEHDKFEHLIKDLKHQLKDKEDAFYESQQKVEKLERSYYNIAAALSVNKQRHDYRPLIDDPLSDRDDEHATWHNPHIMR